MNEKRIKLAATEDVQEFVKAAGNCDFDIDATYQRAIVDAKSLLGILALGLENVLELCIYSDESCEEVVKAISRYVIA